MKFSKGEKVALIDEDLQGIVSEVKEDSILIETDEGFIMEFPEKELVSLEDDGANLDVADFKPEEVIQTKQSSRKPKRTRIKAKEKSAPAMEVDLHINKLVKSSGNLSNYEMLNLQLDTARHKLEFAIQKRIQKIVFIHGVGEGVLKMELETLFGRYSNVKFYDADYKKYGLGATEVYVFQNA